MGFRQITQLTTETRVSIAAYDQGQIEPTYYGISSAAAIAGATSLDLTLATVDGVAAVASDVAELEHDSLLLFPSNNTVAAAGAAVQGSRKFIVDDAAGAVPANLVKALDFIEIAGDTQRYMVVERITNANNYELRLDPELKSAVLDNAAVTVYNKVRLNLGTGIQFQDITNVASSIPVTGVDYAMDAGALTGKTYALRQLLGITDASTTPTINSTEVTDMKSTVTLPGNTSVDHAVTANEWAGNAGLREVAYPLILDPSNNQVGVFVQIETKEGKFLEDLGTLTAAGGAGPVEAASTYNLTISSALGDFFQRWQP